MNYKIPTTFPEQISQLAEMNIIVKDLHNCQLFFSQVSYQRFSVYFCPFIDHSTGKCFNGITFERIQQIYFFDQKIRVFILEIIEDIEIAIRTEFAYYHTNKYGQEGYLTASNYNTRHDHVAFENHIHSCITKNRDFLTISHQETSSEDHFPLCEIIEFFSMGMLSHFYRSLVTKDQKQIAKELYHTSPAILLSWLRCITDLRNKCAHFSRLYYWQFTAIPKMPKNSNYVPTRRLFAQLYMLMLMYPDTAKWNQYYLKRLFQLIQDYSPYISLKHMDFPHAWKTLLSK